MNYVSNPSLYYHILTILIKMLSLVLFQPYEYFDFSVLNLLYSMSSRRRVVLYLTIQVFVSLFFNYIYLMW